MPTIMRMLASTMSAAETRAVPNAKRTDSLRADTQSGCEHGDDVENALESMHNIERREPLRDDSAGARRAGADGRGPTNTAIARDCGVRRGDGRLLRARRDCFVVGGAAVWGREGRLSGR